MLLQRKKQLSIGTQKNQAESAITVLKDTPSFTRVIAFYRMMFRGHLQWRLADAAKNNTAPALVKEIEASLAAFDVKNGALAQITEEAAYCTLLCYAAEGYGSNKYHHPYSMDEVIGIIKSKYIITHDADMEFLLEVYRNPELPPHRRR